MTSDEIISAMKNKLPVVCNGIEYAYILEYVLTYDENGKQRRSVGLLDRNMNSLVRVNLERVSLV